MKASGAEVPVAAYAAKGVGSNITAAISAEQSGAHRRARAERDIQASCVVAGTKLSKQGDSDALFRLERPYPSKKAPTFSTMTT
jgi:uncharacterized protein YfaP (DUF2135 family)